MHKKRDHANTTQVLHARHNWAAAKIGLSEEEKNYHQLKMTNLRVLMPNP